MLWLNAYECIRTTTGTFFSFLVPCGVWWWWGRRRPQQQQQRRWWWCAVHKHCNHILSKFLGSRENGIYTLRTTYVVRRMQGASHSRKRHTNRTNHTNVSDKALQCTTIAYVICTNKDNICSRMIYANFLCAPPLGSTYIHQTNCNYSIVVAVFESMAWKKKREKRIDRQSREEKFVESAAEHDTTTPTERKRCKRRKLCNKLSRFTISLASLASNWTETVVFSNMNATI